MINAKYLLITTLFLATSFSKSFAGSNPSINASNGEVVYKHTFKLSANVNEDDAYDLVQAWLTQNPDKFTSQNTEASVSIHPSKRKVEIENVFNNPQPLQSLDPISKRITAKGVVKYLGAVNSTINLLYLEYYVILQMNGHELTATIGKIKYHHYSRGYSDQLIYNWQGGKPLDSADNYEKLLTVSNPDVNKVSEFLSDGMANLFTDLKQLLTEKSALAER